MFGEINFIFYPIALIAVVSAVTDFLYGKIYNWLTLPAIIFGLMAGAMFGSWAGLGNSALGVGSALVLYGWMYWVGVMGAGDVKLLMAFGAWGGFHYSVDVAIVGVLVAGILALATLTVRGKLIGFLKRMYYFFLTLLIKELEIERPKIDQTQTMPFGVSLSIAALWVKLSNPLVILGVSLWN